MQFARMNADRLDPADVVEQLLYILGVKMVAAMVQEDDHAVIESWAHGTPPDPDTEARLRKIFQVVYLLRQGDSVAVTRAWFVGKNPNLDHRAPALVIAEGRTNDALAAAATYAEVDLV